MTITQVADKIGVSAKTVLRWEKAGKVPKSKRDWRGWRFYTKEDLKELQEFRNAVYF